MKKILLFALLLISTLGFSQNYRKITVREEFKLADSSVFEITTGNTLATKEWTINNAAILTGNPNEIFFNSNGILGASPRFTYNPNDSTMTVDSLLLANGQRIYWNSDEYTIDIPTGLGPVLQTGQEIYILIYNDGSQTIDDCTVLRPLAAVDVGGIIFPTVEKAISNTFSGIEGTIMVSTMDIPPGTVGVATRFGKVRSCNTSAFSPGDGLFISAIDSGELVNVRPSFPNYEISVGGVLVADNDSGQIIVSITRDVSYTFNNFWNGTFRETFDFRTVSNGTTIKGYIKPANGHDDMTAIFSDGFYIFDTSPADTIVLTAGTDINPQTNYVYVPKSTKVLTVSTSDWPTTEHIKVAQVALQTAITTQNNGALRNQNWNDEIQNTNTNQGHLSHIGEKLRAFEAQWYSGAEGSITIGGGNEVWVSNTQGKVRQMHLQTFPALDMQTGDSLSVVNDFTESYIWVGDLKDITTDASGGALLNTSFSVVVWGVINKTGEVSHLMANFPSDTYSKTSPINAVNDALNYSVYDIPTQFQGVGFLIARFTLVDNSGTWSIYDTEDLRGRIPNTTAGGGAGGTGVTSFLGLTDTESSYTAYEFQVANAGATALESPSGLTYNDSLTLNGNFHADTIKARESILINDSLYLTKIDQSSFSGTFFMSNRSDFTGLSDAKTESGEFNTYIGYKSGLNSILSKKNTALGYGALEKADSGWANTAIGYNAGANITGDFDIIANDGFGYANTMVGSGAGFNTTRGAYNTFIGTDAGIMNTEGKRNTFVGVHSGNENTTGIYNTAIGWRSNSQNQTGNYNTVIGPLAGYDNTASYTVLLGLNAGYANESNYTIAIGRNAGIKNTTGSDNFYLGFDAGSENITGNKSIYFGTRAGDNATGGDFNIYLGYQAGKGLSTGSRFWNTIIGGDAGFNNWKSGNTFIGYRAGYLNQTGQTNVFIGKEAGYNELGSEQLYIENSNADKFNSLIWGDFANDSLRLNANVRIKNKLFVDNIHSNTNQITLTANNITAMRLTEDTVFVDSVLKVGELIFNSNSISIGDDNNNVFIGENAGTSNTTGGQNVFVGVDAGTNSNANSNIYIGYKAGEDAVSGTGNIYLGYSAGANNLSSANTFLGYTSGQTSVNGVSNVFVGYQSGLSNTGNQNVFVGRQSGDDNTGDNNIFIGYQSDISGNVDNKLVIENSNSSTPLIGGDFSADQIELNGGMIHKVTTVNAATYDLLTSDYILNVTYPSTAAVTSLTLPTAQTVSGRVIIIKDASGNAGTNNITIDTEGGQTIDGAATKVLNGNYESVMLYCDGSNWFIIN
jgi:hypothetical protein